MSGNKRTRFVNKMFVLQVTMATPWLYLRVTANAVSATRLEPKRGLWVPQVVTKPPVCAFVRTMLSGRIVSSAKMAITTFTVPKAANLATVILLGH